MNDARSNLPARARELKGSAAGSLFRGFWPLLVAMGISAAMHFLLAPLVPEFYPRIMLDIGINVILAVSLTMVNGFTGQFSMGHAAFMAVGAYTAATLVYYGSARLIGTEKFASANEQSGVLSTMLPDRNIELTDGTVEMSDGQALLTTRDPLTLQPGRRYQVRLMDDEHAPHATFIADRAGYEEGAKLPLDAKGGVPGAWAGQRALLIQTPRFFTRGDAIFLASLFIGGLAAAVCGLLVGLPSLRLKGDYLALVTLGFGEIIRVIFQNVEALGGALGLNGIPPYTTIFWVLAFVALTVFVVTCLVNSTYGRGFLATHDDEVASAAVGLNTTNYKIVAFVVGAFFAGIAGGLYGHFKLTITPTGFDFTKSIEIVVMVILGGMGNTLGVILAAVLLTLLPELLRPIAEYRMIIYSLLLIVLMLVRPQGLFNFGLRPSKRKVAPAASP